MEADWEIEIGNESPLIDACWQGFVDLRHAPERAPDLPEAQDLPALADSLARLNAPLSRVWTSKCDVWHPEVFDPDELDAARAAVNCALACYIDLLPRNPDHWPDPEQAVRFCCRLCATLHEIRLPACRADLIIRRAFLAPGQPELGITAYLTACGPSPEDACAKLSSALVVVVDALLHTDAGAKLQ